MAITLGSAYGKISIDASGAVKGTQQAKQSVDAFAGALKGGLPELRGYGMQLISAGKDAGLSSTQVRKMASATGIWSQEQIQAARTAQLLQSKSRELAQAIASGSMTTREAGKAWREFADQNKAAVSTLDQVKGLASKASVAIAALAAAAVVAKKVFDFGKEGAQLERTAGKFERLAQSIGTASTALLSDLRKATRGTVSDMELMTSAADFMALGLAKDHDQVVRLASAAGKLGMNMNQLVLTLTNQTTMRFDALGVSVDGFKERLKSLEDTGMDTNAAFTEAFLQQAEAQIERVGDVADTNAGKIMRMEASLANLETRAKVGAAPAIAGVSDALADMLAEGTNLWTLKGSIEFFIRLAKGGRELDDALGKVFRSSKDDVAVLEDLENQIGLSDEAVKFLNDSLKSDAMDEFYRDAVAGGLAAEDFGDGVSQAEHDLKKLQEAEEAARETTKNFLSILDKDVGSPISSFIEDMQWLQAGGGRINAAFDALKKGVESGVIPPELAEKLGGELMEATKDLEVTLDPTKLDEAATELSETLGIPIEEAKKRILSTDGIMGALQELAATEWQINLRFNYSGTIPPGWGGAQPTLPSGRPYTPSPGIGGPGGIPGVEPGDIGGSARGLRGFVPPGFPNDSYLFMQRLTSGERVDITPAGQAPRGQGDMFNDFNINTFPGQDENQIINGVISKLDFARRAWLSGGSYSG